MKLILIILLCSSFAFAGSSRSANKNRSANKSRSVSKSKTVTKKRSGDLGGGQSMKAIKRAFQLSSRDYRALRKYRTDEQAFRAWLKSMSAKKRQQILEKVFEYHILPQIDP